MQHTPYHSASAHIKKSFSIESFDKYILHSNDNFTELTKIIKQCNVDDIHCRFNVWRLCLGVITVQSTSQQKLKQLQESRKQYQQKKDEALKSFHKKSPIKQPVKKNPLLMMGSNKPQQNKQIESDQFLKQEIHKDVERTYQQMKFFQDKAISKLLNLLLFVWCRRNPDVSYKQGMNQLLASVVVCYFKEVEFKTKNDKHEDILQELWQNHLFFNSVEYAESDIFSVFQKIIQIQGDMYKTQADLTIKSKVNPNSKNNTPILQRIMHIKDHKLKHMDLELFRILKLQDVQTKSFMLRWIRCMHTRQFDLENSFVIWDSIFLEFLESQNSKKNKQFQFIDAMCLAMFMYMRSIVFTKQTAGEILQVYQKYPALKRGVYLDELITLAWTICEQLRIQSQNSQTSQSNWFEDSSKIKSLHFMQKKTSEKKPVQSQNKNQHHGVKKIQRTQKQLKQTNDHKKNPQLSKKHTQPTHNASTQKTKQSITHHSEGNVIHQQTKTKQQRLKVEHNSQDKAKQSSVQNKKQNNSLNNKSTSEKEPIKQLTKNTSIDQSVKQTVVEQKQVKSKQDKQRQQKHLKQVRQKQQSLPSPFHNKQPSGSKIPQSLSINLSQLDITQILQNLNQSLPKIRDIDAQSLIRRTIKKIESKVKQASQQHP